MDSKAQFDDASKSVVFAFAAGGKLQPASVTLEALEGLAHSELVSGLCHRRLSDPLAHSSFGGAGAAG
jgi:hypothetical protein